MRITSVKAASPKTKALGGKPLSTLIIVVVLEVKSVVLSSTHGGRKVSINEKIKGSPRRFVISWLFKQHEKYILGRLPVRQPGAPEPRKRILWQTNPIAVQTPSRFPYILIVVTTSNRQL